MPKPANVKDFLELPEVISLPDYERYLLMLLWLLSRKGKLPNNPQWIAWRLSLGIDAQAFAESLKKLMKAGLVVGIGDNPAGPMFASPMRTRVRKPRALRSHEAERVEVFPDTAPPDAGEPDELSPAELLRRHRESWGQV